MKKEIILFKGNLIEDQKYYTLRSRQLLYFILPSLAIGLLVNFYKLPIGVTIAAIIFCLAIMFLTKRNQDEIRKVTKKRIELTKNAIEIKELKGKIIESFKIEKNTKLFIKADYKMVQEAMSDLKEEIKGNTEKHFIVIESINIKRRFDFEIESYFMLNQLEKIVQIWQGENLSIEYVD